MDIKKYRVKPNKKVDLEKFSTKKDDSYSKKEGRNSSTKFGKDV